MYELTVMVEFEAAHRLIGYQGKCNRLHGHNWSVEAVVKGIKLNELGLLVDFKDVKAAAKQVADQLDHSYLNELEAFTKNNPTAEHIAKYLFDSLAIHEIFNDNVWLDAIKVWESPKSAVKYSKDV